MPRASRHRSRRRRPLRRPAAGRRGTFTGWRADPPTRHGSVRGTAALARVYSAGMTSFDSLALATRQLKSDRAKTARFPGLFERKVRRMSTSPLAFLRGAAPLFYTLLHERPELALGPDGEGWLTGDMHLENFGAYRPDPRSFGEPKTKKEKRDQLAVFDLNDFDDAIVGPFRFDVLRLTTSLILAGRELGADGVRVLELCEALLGAYVKAAFGPSRLPDAPKPVRLLVEQVRTRSRKELLDGRTRTLREERSFRRDDPNRYRALSKSIERQVPAAFARYIESLKVADRPEDARALDVLDCALRIAGTGSLGGLRIAVLTRGKGGPGGAWIFDMKEQGDPSAAILVGKPKMDPALRVVAALRANLEHPPRMLGATRLGGASMFVRRLAPQEDKLALHRINRYGDWVPAIHHEDLGALASYLGALLGRAHRRGAKVRPKRPWTSSECASIVDRAIVVAGIHEAMYLAICKIERRLLARG